MHISLNWLNTYTGLSNKKSLEDIVEKLTLSGLEVEGSEAANDFILKLDKSAMKGLGSEERKLLEKDTVLELSITPNRPDALSYFGVARELCALFNKRTLFPTVMCREEAGQTQGKADVQILDKKACPRYACRVVEDIKVGPSPAWLQARLLASGMRPINNIVDATNYIMLERGQPLHAFDMSKIERLKNKTKIFVRRAKSDEKLVTLEGTERKLSQADLVIADSQKAIALAGVMGGQNSEVDNNTTDILIESAYFNAPVVRHMAKKHDLHSEASHRFERGCDPNAVVSSLDAVAQLISEVSGGKTGRGVIDVYPKKIAPLEISFRMERFFQISGLSKKEVSESDIRNLFLLIGVETLGKRGQTLHFRVPTYRPDLTREIDLIEEALRLVGLDKIEPRLSFEKKNHPNLYEHKRDFVLEKIQKSLGASGFYESINYSFGSLKLYSHFGSNKKNSLSIQNPLGEEFSVLRRSLLPGLMNNLKLNINQGQGDIKLYEVGPVFLGARKNGKIPNSKELKHDTKIDAWADEKQFFSGIMCENSKDSALDFYDLKGVLENILDSLEYSSDMFSGGVEFRSPQDLPSHFHPGESAEVFCRVDKSKKFIKFGVLGKLHPGILEQLDIDRDVFGFECDFDVVLANTSTELQVKTLDKFPGMTRDLALVVDENLFVGDLFNTVKMLKVSLLRDVSLFDVYQGKNIESGKKSVALSFNFRHLSRTLKEEEVSLAMDKIIDSLKENNNAKIR